MTTYCYTLYLDDTESTVVEEALKLMIRQCKERLSQGECGHSSLNLFVAERVLKNLYADENIYQTSGNNFDELETTAHWFNTNDALEWLDNTDPNLPNFFNVAGLPAAYCIDIR